MTSSEILELSNSNFSLVY